jgi:predicted RNA-binding protein with PIN domain
MPKRLIIDGYNLIYASKELEALIRESMETAREKLIAEIEDYCLREEREAELVFDGAGSKGPSITEERSGFLKVTFTAEGQSADSYIEKLAYDKGGDRSGEVLLITGDYHQQKVAAGAGLLRMSSREFLLELEESRGKVKEERRRRSPGKWKVPLEDRIPGETKAGLERMRKPRRSE